jgi:RNA polymerase sporulation-specific sigma factor
MVAVQDRVNIVDARNNEYLKEEFFKQNIALVYSVSNRFKYMMNEEERIGIGTFGLLKAFNTYDENSGFTFGTYATRCITNEILQEDRRMCNRFNNKALSLDAPVAYDDKGEEKLLIDSLSEKEEEFTTDTFKSVIKAYKKFIEVYSKKEPKLIEAFNMYIFQDITTAEIAKKLGLATQSGGQRLAMRAIKAIQDIAMDMELIENYNKFYKHKTSKDAKANKEKDIINKRRLLYIVLNYPELTSKEISKITNLSNMKVGQIRANITKGKINLTPDDFFKPQVEKYLEEKSYY